MQKAQHNLTGKAKNWLAVATLMLMAWVIVGGQAHAALVSLDESGFAPTDTLVDFNVLGADTPLTTQYQDDGVIFGGGFFGNTRHASRFPSGSPACVANYAWGGSYTNNLVIDFTDTVTRIGADMFFNFYSTLTMRAYRLVDDQYLLAGQISVPNNTVPDGSLFLGIQDLEGIDRITLYLANPYPVIQFDNLRFDAAAPALDDDNGDPVVPEPATMALMGLGLAGVGLIRRRRHA